MRFLRNVRGWDRVVTALVPADAAEEFSIKNPTGFFAGDLSSFIDRRMYLFGEYEREFIRLFTSKIPAHSRGTVLDIGANVGTHSLAFARHFEQVHAFEPNPRLWENFARNVELNHLANVRLHKLGLGERDGQFPFFLIDKNNYGLGTFSSEAQYDLPLKQVAELSVVRGDDYLELAKIGPVNAIKIDVQGVELEVVRGLVRVLERDRPFVWIEVGEATTRTIATATELKALFPFECTISRFQRTRPGIFHSAKLVDAPEERLQQGDHLIVPVAPTRPHTFC